jgi:putative peptidoglycan lipid II flippase
MALSFSSLFKNNGNWLEQQQNSILSAASVLTVAYIISSLSGLLRQRLLISKFFDTPASQQAYEAFLVAFQIPDMMFQLIIIGALSAAFIPIFTTYKKQDQALAFQISSIMMNVLLLVFLVVGVIVFIWAEPLTVWRTGHTFTPEQISIATRLTRIMLVAQFFFAVSNFLTGILQSFQRFIIPSIAPVLYNLGILMGVYLFAGSLGIYSAGLGVIIGAFMHMIVQLPLVMKLGFRYQFTFNVKLPGIREFFKLMPPRVLALSVNELRKLSLGFFATSLGNLSFVVMQLGLTLMAIPIRFFGVPISQASLPFLSDESDEKDRQRFTHLVLQSLNQIAFFTMPMSVLLLILRVPIVRLIFGTANFPWETTLATGRVVAIISISITVQGMVQLMMRAFYALKDTKTPFVIAMVDMIFYLLACAYFVFYTDLGVIGIALATSAAAFLEFILFIFFLNHKVKGLMSKAFWLPQFKMVMASFLMAVFLYLPFKILDELVFNTTRTIELLGLTVTTTTIGMVVYIYFAMLFNIYELQTLLKVINRFGPWKGILHKAEEVLLETAVEGDEV